MPNVRDKLRSMTPSTSHASPPVNVPKATGTVEIAEPGGKLTLADRQLFNHLLAHAYRRLTTDEWHSVQMSDIRRFAAEARGGVPENDNRRMKDSVRRLQQTTVEFNYLRSDGGRVWESSPLLSTCRIDERAGTLQYSFPSGLRERLVEPALYSMISLRVQWEFDSKYGLVLYETLKRYADRDHAQPWWSVKTSELRDLLGCRDKLTDWKDFRRRALDPALEEIDRLAEFRVTISEQRQGRGRGGGQVVAVTFNIERKAVDEAAAAIRELDKPKAQRRGEKKAKVEDAATAAASRKALNFLTGADAATRLRWTKRAHDLGIDLPKAASAVENLPKWVPQIADTIIAEERIR